MNLSRIIGPAIAGAMLLVAPIETIFWINGVSFLAVLWTLIVVKSGSLPRPSDRSEAGLGEAISYIRGDGSIVSLLILAVVPMVFGFPYTSLMPLFARDLLHLGPTGFGALLSISAAGALAGSTWLSLCHHRGPRGEVWSLRRSVSAGPAAVHGFVVVRGSGGLPVPGRLFQSGLSHDEPHHPPGPGARSLRGRILSIALMDRGLIPLGAILIGAVAELAGAMCAGLLDGRRVYRGDSGGALRPGARSGGSDRRNAAGLVDRPDRSDEPFPSRTGFLNMGVRRSEQGHSRSTRAAPSSLPAATGNRISFVSKRRSDKSTISELPGLESTGSHGEPRRSSPDLIQHLWRFRTAYRDGRDAEKLLRGATEAGNGPLRCGGGGRRCGRAGLGESQDPPRHARGFHGTGRCSRASCGARRSACLPS